MAGPAVANRIWTDALNWNGGEPASGDLLYFDLALPNANLTTGNDMAGLTNLTFAARFWVLGDPSICSG